MRSDAVSAGLELLQQLLRVESTAGGSRETEAASLLLEHARSHGLPGQVVEPKIGSGSFIGTLDGMASPRILLHSHLDVAQAGRVEDWAIPPFSGLVTDGWVWGRGAVDLKSLAAAHFAVMLTLKDDPIPLPVVMAAAAEEESAGQNGTAWLVKNRPEIRRCKYALGEGGGWVLELGSRAFMTVQTGEKGVGRFLISERSGEAVESMTWCQSPANASALEFVSRVASLPMPVIRRLPTQVIARIARRVQAGAPFRVDSDGMLMHGCTSAIGRDGQVMVTCRPLPGTSIRSLLARFCRSTRATIHAPVGDAIEASESLIGSEIQAALASATGLPLVPIITGGPSDNHWLREAGITTFGFFPGPTAAEVVRIHRPNERLSVQAFAAAVQGLLAAVRHLAEYRYKTGQHHVSGWWKRR